jgi:hypothetical protein
MGFLLHRYAPEFTIIAVAPGVMGFTVVPFLVKSTFALRSMAVPKIAKAKAKYEI